MTRAMLRMAVMIHHLDDDDDHNALFMPNLPAFPSEIGRLTVLHTTLNNEAGL
jgi:hypothetical protein